MSALPTKTQPPSGTRTQPGESLLDDAGLRHGRGERVDLDALGSLGNLGDRVARFTRATATLASLNRAFSMRPTQDAHVEPPMSSVQTSAAVSASVMVFVDMDSSKLNRHLEEACAAL